MKKTRVANRILVAVLIAGTCLSLCLLRSAQSYAADEIPAYNGAPSVAINNNVPGFTADEITTSSFELYGETDRLGRCTAAVACVGRDLMPAEEREDISEVRPT